MLRPLHQADPRCDRVQLLFPQYLGEVADASHRYHQCFRDGFNILCPFVRLQRSAGRGRKFDPLHFDLLGDRRLPNHCVVLRGAQGEDRVREADQQ